MGDGYILLPPDHPQHKTLVPKSAKLLQNIEADTFEDAAQQEYDILGWGKYHPMCN